MSLAQTASSIDPNRILLVITPWEKEYLQRIKPLFGVSPVSVATKATIVTVTEITSAAKRAGITKIVSTNKGLLERLTFNPKASLSDFAGSMFHHDGCEILFLEPLDHLIKVAHAPMVFGRYISKFTKPGTWAARYCPEFSWKHYAML